MALTTASANRKDLINGNGPVTFEHRHFAKIAAMIAGMEKVSNQEHGFIDVREDIAEHFADELSSTNPRFDRKRFMKACGF